MNREELERIYAIAERCKKKFDEDPDGLEGDDSQIADFNAAVTPGVVMDLVAEVLGRRKLSDGHFTPDNYFTEEGKKALAEAIAPVLKEMRDRPAEGRELLHAVTSSLAKWKP